MKKLSFQNYATLAFILFSLTIIGCKDYSSRDTVGKIIKRATAPYNNGEEVGPVAPVPQRSVPVKIDYQGGRFWVETRKDKIERFECTRCHDGKEAGIERAAEMTHGDIVLTHGRGDYPFTCFSCHDQDNRDFLVVGERVKVDVDHAYEMCGRCHFKQKRDWVGGAHGKRIAYWAGERVVKNCTGCHNPHSPKFTKRWPKTFSRPLSE